MRKKQTITINIPEPCHESWAEMQPSGCGRHCAHCEKVVIDFTQMSDEEIIKIFTAQKDNPPCGRFTNAQLNRPLILNEQRKPFHIPALMAKIAAAFLLVPTFIQQSFAQTAQKPKTEQSPVPANNKPILLKGKIIDSASGQPLVAMEISIDKLNYVEYSDRNGNFSFLLPGGLRNQDITIRADYQPTSSPEIKETIILPLTLFVSDNLLNKVWQLKRINGIAISPSISIERDFTMGVSPRPTNELTNRLNENPGVKLTNEQHKNQTIDSPTFWQRIGRFFKGKK